MSGKASLVRLPEQCHEGSIMVPHKGSRRVSGVGFGMLRMFLGVGIPVCWGGGWFRVQLLLFNGPYQGLKFKVFRAFYEGLKGFMRDSRGLS